MIKSILEDNIGGSEIWQGYYMQTNSKDKR
jgi:hypothetical protein